MDDLVYNSDNGIITLALQLYIKTAIEMGGDQKLIDRASELEIIFKNRSARQFYDYPEGGFGEQGFK